MAIENVSVIAEGRQFFGWKRVSVKAGIGRAFREFEITTAEVPKILVSPFDVWHFPPFTPIQVLAGGDVIIDGYVETYAPGGGPEYHQAVIKGSGQSKLLVDSSPYHPTGVFERKTVLDILTALAAPFGVAVGVLNAQKAASAVVPYFAIRRGETVWSEAMRLLGDYGATLSGQPDKSAAIARAGEQKHAGVISQLPMVDSIPIKDMSAIITGEGRYSDYDVTWQNGDGDDEDLNLFGQEKAKDSGVPLFKYKEVIAATEMDKQRARNLANWNAVRAAGFSTRATVQVPGWRDTAGKLWEPSQLVFLTSPWLKIESDITIADVAWEQNESGTTSTLQLVDPRAYGGKATTASNNGSMWNWSIIDLF